MSVVPSPLCIVRSGLLEEEIRSSVVSLRFVNIRGTICIVDGAKVIDPHVKTLHRRVAAEPVLIVCKAG